MKKLFFFPIVLFALSVFVSSCSSASSTPDGAAMAFIKAMQNENFDKARHYIKITDRDWKRMVQSFYSDASNELAQCEIRVGEVKINEAGNSASVELIAVIDGKDNPETFSLKLVDGRWFIIY